jgi:hypothetical protein
LKNTDRVIFFFSSSPAPASQTASSFPPHIGCAMPWPTAAEARIWWWLSRGTTNQLMQRA